MEWVEGRAVQLGWLSPPISPRELEAWAGFERVLGPILAGERIDMAAAVVSTSAFAAAGHKSKLTDFLPKWDEQATTPAMDPELIQATLERLAERRHPDDDTVHPKPRAQD